MGVIERMISGLAAALALLLGAGCLLAALAAQGGRFSTRLDVLTHFAPFWLAGGLVALACAAMLTPSASKSWALAVAGLAVAAAAALVLPELLRPIRPAVAATAPRQVKLVQLNAWGDNVDVEGTADWIARQQPDLVFIEELEQPLRTALVRRGYHPSSGMMRTSVFSRTPPQAASHRISEADYRRLPPFARGTFQVDGIAFDVIATHLTWPTWPGQQVEIKALKALIDRYDKRRLILMGDFNLTPWSFTLRQIDRTYGLERRDRALFSWPARPFARGRLSSPGPFLPIDHVYAGSAWRTVKIERGPRLGSDHYPVLVVLALED